MTPASCLNAAGSREGRAGRSRRQLSEWEGRGPWTRRLWLCGSHMQLGEGALFQPEVRPAEGQSGVWAGRGVPAPTRSWELLTLSLDLSRSTDSCSLLAARP